MTKSFKPVEAPIDRLTFSFAHLDTDHNKFPIAPIDESTLRKIWNRVKELSTYGSDKFTDYELGPHCHSIDFDETSEKDGWGITKQLEEDFYNATPWQFPASDERREACRIHGVLVGSVFFVVWIDLNHQLYPMNVSD